jgi:alpha-tubulin suppressor-like RCC1 family protein
MDYGEYVRMKKTPVGYVRMKMTGLPAGAQIASVSCGMNHAAYTLASGEVCTSGFGEYGQLGRGDPDEMKHRVGVNGGGHEVADAQEIAVVPGLRVAIEHDSGANPEVCA